MCSVIPRDRKSNQELLACLGITVDVAEEVRRERPKWFGHVERKNAIDYVLRCRNVGLQEISRLKVKELKVDRARRGMNVVEEDMEQLAVFTRRCIGSCWVE